MRLRKLWEPLDGEEATLHEHQMAAEIARIAWCVFAVMLLVVVFLVAGCSTVPCSKPADPYDTHVDPDCETSCAQDVADGDPVAALQRCENRRKLCHNAINRGREAKAIK